MFESFRTYSMVHRRRYLCRHSSGTQSRCISASYFSIFHKGVSLFSHAFVLMREKLLLACVHRKSISRNEDLLHLCVSCFHKNIGNAIKHRLLCNSLLVVLQEGLQTLYLPYQLVLGFSIYHLHVFIVSVYTTTMLELQLETGAI